MGLILVGLLLVVVGFPFAEEPADSLPEPEEYIPRYVENNAFGPGERLVFSVEYGIIKAGTATLEVTGPEDYEGALAYRISATARSNPAFSTFFEVNDVNEAVLDAVQFHTLRFFKSLQEGSYSHQEEVLFDQEAGIARYPDETDSSKMVSEIPPHALDVLSSLYYARTLPLEVGEVYELETHTDNENYSLKVTVHSRERIRVPAGSFECVMVQPELRSEGVFDQQGELYVWLTDDQRHMPVLMRSAIVIGEIACLLEEYTPGEPLDIENPFPDGEE
ncbi:DUF3108 domain-containing protein [Candidatus Fermentibacteria bacterium]|nr:DUF3108 domain-containing protein [Candidatus Fermentibacteria bacterium]